MTKLTTPVSILSKSKVAAQLVAIDVETMTCTIDNGKEKIVKWSSAAEYKLDTDTGATRTLTPKLLTALHDAESVHHADETTDEIEVAQETDYAEEVSEPVVAVACEPHEVATDTTSVPEVSAPVTAETQISDEPQKVKRQRTPRGTLNDKEKMFLALIPAQPDYEGVESEMMSRTLIKKAMEIHGLPINNGRAVFVSLKNKGYYSAKGRESGLNLTTFQLTEQGVRYLTENNLIPVHEISAQ